MRNGADTTRFESGKRVSVGFAYREMLLQITRDYSGLPDVRALTLSQIFFFYDGERDELRRATRPAPPATSAARRPRKARKR